MRDARHDAADEPTTAHRDAADEAARIGMARVAKERLFALAVVALLGGSLLVVILTLGLLKWDRFAVVMRSAMRGSSQAFATSAASVRRT